MAKQNHGDFYSTVKHHLFQIFVLILFLFRIFKVLEAEAPPIIFRMTKIILDRL